MNGVGFGELIMRMVISLVVVLGLLLGAYWFIKRRQSGAVAPRGAWRGSGLRRRGGAAPSRNSAKARGLKIVGRVGLSRTSTVIALQFAERVILLGTSEQGSPAVLAELDLDSWNAANERDELVPVTRVPVGGSPVGGRARPSLLESLREVTARRG
jgi:flagellar biogenesis protein FliO